MEIQPGSFITVNTPVNANIGDIDMFGGLVMGKIKDLGPGDLNLFAAGAVDITHPNDNVFSLPFFSLDGGQTFQNAGFGLLYDAPNKQSHTGYFGWIGGRYDIKSTRTKLGFEWNYGSKYWFSFVPAGDDMWTSKVGTRGNVYELYAIQELNKIPISKKGKAFFRLGWQYFDFNYTGTNSFVGEPKKIADLNSSNPANTQLLAPLKHAYDIYLTFDVQF